MGKTALNCYKLMILKEEMHTTSYVNISDRREAGLQQAILTGHASVKNLTTIFSCSSVTHSALTLLYEFYNHFHTEQ